MKPTDPERTLSERLAEARKYSAEELSKTSDEEVESDWHDSSWGDWSKA